MYLSPDDFTPDRLLSRGRLSPTVARCPVWHAPLAAGAEPHSMPVLQVLLNEVKNDLNNLKVDMNELEELRELRADVARKEKAHADLIASQAKRLDELEALYKEEQVPPTPPCTPQLNKAVACRHGRLCRNTSAWRVSVPASLPLGDHSNCTDGRVGLEMMRPAGAPVVQVTRKRLFNTIQDMKGKIRVFCRVRPMLDFESERGQKIAISIPDELTAAHFWKDEKKPREYPFDQVPLMPLPLRSPSAEPRPRGLHLGSAPQLRVQQHMHAVHACCHSQSPQTDHVHRGPSIANV